VPKWSDHFYGIHNIDWPSEVFGGVKFGQSSRDVINGDSDGGIAYLV
jgi:hypothetical protein